MNDLHNISQDSDDFGGHCSNCEIWKMAAIMVAEDTGIAWFFVDEKNGEPGLFLNLNDVFAPAADSEDVPFELIPEVFDIWKASGVDGVIEWVRKSRDRLNQQKGGGS